MAIDNTTGKNKEFYEIGKRMFDRIKPLTPTKPYIDFVQADIDLLYEVNSVDIEALENAKVTLLLIRKVDPGVYDEFIDESLVLIEKALGMSYTDALERVVVEAKRK